MQKSTPSRTPTYHNAPLSNSPSLASASLNNASIAIANATGTSTGPASWDTLRKDVRQIENEIESKITALSKFAVRNGPNNGAGVGSGSTSASGAGSSTSAGTGEELEVNIEELLEKVRPIARSPSLFSPFFSLGLCS